MNHAILFFAVTLVSTLSWAKAEAWVLDAQHSKVGFSISHLIISSVEGSFRSVEGTINYDPKNPVKDIKNFSVDVTIDAKSIDTGNQKRDDHLRSKDFFDVEKFPTVTFKSEKIETENGKDYKVHGLLTLAGKSKKVILKTKFAGEADAYDVKRVAFKASTKIKREDFGLTWNDIVESGPVVGSEVEITITAQGKRKADL